MNRHAISITSRIWLPISSARYERACRGIVLLPLSGKNVRVGPSASGHTEGRRENRRRPARLGGEFPGASLSRTNPSHARDAIFPANRSGVPSMRALRVLPGNSAWAERFFPGALLLSLAVPPSGSPLRGQGAFGSSLKGIPPTVPSSPTAGSPFCVITCGPLARSCRMTFPGCLDSSRVVTKVPMSLV